MYEQHSIFVDEQTQDMCFSSTAVVALVHDSGVCGVIAAVYPTNRFWTRSSDRWHAITAYSRLKSNIFARLLSDLGNLLPRRLASR